MSRAQRSTSIDSAVAVRPLERTPELEREPAAARRRPRSPRARAEVHDRGVVVDQPLGQAERAQRSRRALPAPAARRARGEEADGDVARAPLQCAVGRAAAASRRRTGRPPARPARGGPRSARARRGSPRARRPPGDAPRPARVRRRCRTRRRARPGCVNSSGMSGRSDVRACERRRGIGGELALEPGERGGVVHLRAPAEHGHRARERRRLGRDARQPERHGAGDRRGPDGEDTRRWAAIGSHAFAPERVEQRLEEERVAAGRLASRRRRTPASALGAEHLARRASPSTRAPSARGRTTAAAGSARISATSCSFRLWPGGRVATRTSSGRPSSRRCRWESQRSDGPSAQCRSSIASSSRARGARGSPRASRGRAASRTRRRSDRRRRPCSSPVSKSVAARAAGAARAARSRIVGVADASTGSKSWRTTPKANSCSSSPPRAVSTVRPARAAAARASARRRVLPMPARALDRDRAGRRRRAAASTWACTAASSDSALEQRRALRGLRRRAAGDGRRGAGTGPRGRPRQPGRPARAGRSPAGVPRRGSGGARRQEARARRAPRSSVRAGSARRARCRRSGMPGARRSRRSRRRRRSASPVWRPIRTRTVPPSGQVVPGDRPLGRDGCGERRPRSREGDEERVAPGGRSRRLRWPRRRSRRSSLCCESTAA